MSQVTRDKDLNEGSSLENGITWRSDLLKSKSRSIRINASFS